MRRFSSHRFRSASSPARCIMLIPSGCGVHRATRRTVVDHRQKIRRPSAAVAVVRIPEHSSRSRPRPRLGASAAITRAAVRDYPARRRSVRTSAKIAEAAHEK